MSTESTTKSQDTVLLYDMEAGQRFSFPEDPENRVFLVRDSIDGVCYVELDPTSGEAKMEMKINPTTGKPEINPVTGKEVFIETRTGFSKLLEVISN